MFYTSDGPVSTWLAEGTGTRDLFGGGPREGREPMDTRNKPRAKWMYITIYNPRHDTWDCHICLYLDPLPQLTTPGRFEGSPTGQCQTVRVWDPGLAQGSDRVDIHRWTISLDLPVGLGSVHVPRTRLAMTAWHSAGGRPSHPTETTGSRRMSLHGAQTGFVESHETIDPGSA